MGEIGRFGLRHQRVYWNWRVLLTNSESKLIEQMMGRRAGSQRRRQLWLTKLNYAGGISRSRRNWYRTSGYGVTNESDEEEISVMNLNSVRQQRNMEVKLKAVSVAQCNRNGIVLVGFDYSEGKNEVIQEGIYHFNNKPFTVKAWHSDMEFNMEELYIGPIGVKLPAEFQILEAKRFK
ncbi:hypothetical protein HAX54_027148 [Datura stramonium]|uniref:Uncharacterized protein n=1 Tax=Datura stramonium TaxID=4076 RepID=A0ABS8RKH9_DATST|nr:hypothetical protein [Datura stramonium]